MKLEVINKKDIRLTSESATDAMKLLELAQEVHKHRFPQRPVERPKLRAKTCKLCGKKYKYEKWHKKKCGKYKPIEYIDVPIIKNKV